MRRTIPRRSGGTLIAIVAATSFAAAGCGGGSSAGSSGSASSSGSGSPAPKSVLSATPKAATGTPIKIGGFTDSSLGPQTTQSQGGFKAAVSYVNDYLGGVNNHPLQVDFCDVKGTPAGGTNCAVQFRKDNVAAVVTPSLAVDNAAFTALTGSGIPYITYATAAVPILFQPGAFVVGSPVAVTAAPVAVAKSKGITKVGLIIIDVPAAVGPTKMLATPIFAKAGVSLDMVPIPLGTPDMTPQIQQAISRGDKMIDIVGPAGFVGQALKSVKQLGFNGTIVIDPSQFDKAGIESVPGGLAGTTAITQISTDQSDKDVQTYNAVMDKYAPDVDKASYASSNYQVLLAFQRALEGVAGATDAKSIMKAFGSMPKPVAVPMGAGITFQCGSKPVAITPNACSNAVLTADVDANGHESNVKTLDVSPYLKLG